MIANLASFPNGEVPANVYLAARGFSKLGQKSGGLQARLITIPAGTHLLRLHDGATPLGPWWFTPSEYFRVRQSLAITGAGLLRDRSLGRSAMHLAFALLSEWYADRSDQLARFTALELKADFQALYGPGDSGVGRNGKRLDPVRLAGDQAARQIFLPDLRFYTEHIRILTSSGLTDAHLEATASMYRGESQPFER